jgi:hypothetical protein
VVYAVSLKMSPTCKADFLRQVHALRKRLQPDGYPTGADDSWISVQDKGGGELVVTYTT